jgi:ribosomal protein S18 acetylase RimI-like enzyme
MLYTSSLKDVSPEMLEGGFFVGWPNPPSSEMHYKLLKNSYKAVIVIEKDTKQVVGFINAVSDGVLSAYIPLLEVLPEYQNQGIGKKLIQLLLEELKDIYMIDLMCDKELQPYYEKVGMVKAKGMISRNYKCQSGRQG